MKAFLRVASWIDRFTEAAGELGAYLVLLVVAVGFYNVFVRYTGRFTGVQLSSNLYIEMQWYLFSLIFFLGFAYVLKHGLNVRVDFFYANWSVKRRAWVDLLGTLLFLIPFCLIGIYVTINPVLTSWGRLPDGSFDLADMEFSPDPQGLPRAPIKSMIIVAFLMLLFQSMAQCIKYVAVIRGHEEVAATLPKQADVS